MDETVAPDIESPSTPRRLDLREERLNRTIFSLAFPAILENLMLSMVFFSDSFIVGWLHNENALAGTLLAGTLLMFGSTPFQALSVATSSLVSRYWGEQNFQKAQKYAAQSLSIVFLFSIFILLIGWPLAYRLIAWMGGSPQVVQQGGLYMRILLLSSPIAIPLFISNGIIRATGNTKTPMLISLTMNIIHVALSIILAFGYGPFPPMGLKGVALGSMIAELIGGLTSLTVLMRGITSVHLPFSSLFQWELPILRQTFTLGLPVIIERTINTGAYTLFMTIVALLGTTALAAHNLALRMESLSFMPAFGVSIAVSTIVGQSLGARLPHIAETAVRRTLFWASIFTISLGILFALFARHIVVIFGATPNVLHLASIAIRISALELPFLSFSMILIGALRGAGDTKSPLYIMLICIPIFRFGVLYLFAIVFGWGLAGVWLATALDWAFRTLGLWWIFNRGVWKSIHEKQHSSKT